MFLISQDFWKIENTKNKGKGVFAQKEIKKGTIIGDYLGKATRYEEVETQDIEYMMFFDDEFAIVPDRNISGIYLLNHSCDPNCFMYPFKGHMLFISIKDIAPKEELTISYLYPPQESCSPCDHVCFCGNINCTGTLHSSKKLHERWGKFKEEQIKKHMPEKSFENGNLLPLKEYPETLIFDFDFL